MTLKEIVLLLTIKDVEKMLQTYSHLMPFVELFKVNLAI